MLRLALEQIFRPNESPYLGMFRAGTLGWDIKDICDYLSSINVPLRNKDVENWKNGIYKYRTRQLAHDGRISKLNPFIAEETHYYEQQDSFKPLLFDELPRFPIDWVGCERRFFPCSIENKPMCKWGWSKDFIPSLYDLSSAKALSPCGWVGQNMIYQRFIVLDIDGVGHGIRDPYVIAFGNIFRNETLCLEDPAKPGSFHLYFETDRIVPIKHFPWAKLDLMGNQTNAAVYLKNKVPNGLAMKKLDQKIWDLIMQYAGYRKEQS